MAAMLRSILVLALAFGAASCTTVPRPVATADFCGFEMHRAEVALPPPDRGSLLTAVEPANAMLLLSGGSLHGAFGAGVLARWKELNGGLPRFRTVTGVSTGALLSTDAFIDRPEAARQAYSIERESQLLTPYARRNAKGGFNATGYLSIVRNNAVADLAPLRAMLHDHISMDVLKQVVARAWGRRLLVGAVDVDSGDAVVFDMLDMARKAVNAAGPRGEHFRNCYIDAIVASSSVPLAAKPVVIDNRMYIDGGARFGVFLDAFGSEAGVDRRDTPPGPPPQLYILVNGMQRVKAQCGKVDRTLCAADGTDPFDRREGAHAGWNLLGLAQRSSDILVAQIYRFSAADIIARYRERYGAAAVGNVHYFQIESNEMLAHPFRNSTCAGLHEEEEVRLRPLQFYPNYMACLIDYGRASADRRAGELRIGRP
ncbi:patatin-like phospholipase family protein [Sphingomonas sp. A2-49]|uniref:patatin-like phospholipase family protein n=1 Tax=Sphingomonas sp. A2-49 TaxID=1391375 RepID=UPI0021D0C7B6|nr:patatin-like phospholipase family protein [Sphingomonas sp. A2-49]MCU6456020.1 patatin-like phospholipase family protein [Sphingomonas sp. A2-49]